MRVLHLIWKNIKKNAIMNFMNFLWSILLIFTVLSELIVIKYSFYSDEIKDMKSLVFTGIFFGILVLDFCSVKACRCGEQTGWSQWSSCTRTCARGSQSQSRNCYRYISKSFEIWRQRANGDWYYTGKKGSRFVSCYSPVNRQGHFPVSRKQPCNDYRCRKFKNRSDGNHTHF